MIFEHEIPEGSKLYFSTSAKIKRHIESVASEILDGVGFEEIITPLFSFHQHLSVNDERELIHISDADNRSMSLRADTTIDVVRIVNKRLGGSTEHKKWFYIQPVYTYPSQEQYQIGAEVIDEDDLALVLEQSIEILNSLEVAPLLQISNINIPRILSKMLDLDLSDFRHINIEKFLSLKIEWLNRLVYLERVDEIDEVATIVPDEIRVELLKIKELCAEIKYPRLVVAPLYYAKMLYYDELFFRFIDDNKRFVMGGRYKNEDSVCVGFAIYTDALIEALSK